jgi:hypothetical protein
MDRPSQESNVCVIGLGVICIPGPVATDDKADCTMTKCAGILQFFRQSDPSVEAQMKRIIDNATCAVALDPLENKIGHKRTWSDACLRQSVVTCFSWLVVSA